MARVLLVEDDPDQRELRELILSRAGHEVISAGGAQQALDGLARRPEVAVMDLSLPRPEDGRALLRELAGRSPAMRVAVLTGRSEALRGQPEESLAAALLEKPCPTKRLLETIAHLAARLAVCMALSLALAAAREFTFNAEGRGETIAELDLRSSDSDWAVKGREAAVARISLDGAEPFHVWVLGERRGAIGVFLGKLAPGRHRVTVERDERFSAAGSNLEVRGAKFREDASPMVAHAPVLFAREDTLGLFSDVPLLVYAERVPNGWQYTVVFSHEDGGTSTRGLMAVWGRTTDIEYVYRVDDAGAGIIQGPGHKDVAFSGERMGEHPLLIPVTKNNMVAAGKGALRLQITPVELPELTAHSREIAMDKHPWTWTVAAKELVREDRAKEIGDPRNYLYIEGKLALDRARAVFRVRLTTETAWRVSHRNDVRMAIARSGWVRSTVELPPNTGPRQIAELGIECIKELEAGSCKLEQLSPAFFLTPDYFPGRPFKLPVK
jgi:CheY-like chemotaxis protein